MWPKYEEKTYENYFNAELAQRSNIYFPLGQVQEGFLGFDSSAFSLNAELWRRLGFPFISFPLFPGVNTRDLERFMGYMFDELPPFKANLLFQYKRPELITLSSGSEWHQWSKPYYRYKIYQEQQQLLMLIHGAFSDQVLTLYAAPAIFDVRELAQKSMDRRIIEFSNFQQCHRLDGHHLNTFTEAGTHSVACSDPET